MKKVEVEVSYEGRRYPAHDEVFNRLAAQFGGKSVASGMGFGARDLVYEFSSVAKADQFKDRAKYVKDVVALATL